MSGQRLSVEPHGLPFGEDASGRMVAVADVERGLACGLVCPHCRSRLVAKKGDVISHHLAHEADMACAAAYETALHKMAKQIITDAGAIRVPPLWVRLRLGTACKMVQPEISVPFDRVEMEVWMDGMRPDIVGYRKDTPLAVEILVTHGCGPEKVSLFRSRKLAAIEIDLSGLDRDITPDKLKPIVLTSAPRHWVFHPGREAALAQLRAEAEAREAEIKERAEKAAARQAEEERLQAERLREWQEEQKREEQERARIWQERREQELAVQRKRDEKKQLDAVRVAEIKRALYKRAEETAGNIFAPKFMGSQVNNGWGGLLPAPFQMKDPGLERYYWSALDYAILEAQINQETRDNICKDVFERASEVFRSEEQAERWFQSWHPAPGVAPSAACIDPDGWLKCINLLRRVRVAA